MDPHGVVGGKPRDVRGFQSRGRVLAIGQQHDGSGRRGIGEDALEREAQSVGDRGRAAGQTDLRRFDRPHHGGKVVGERRRHIGPIGEDHEPDPVAPARGDEGRGYPLHGGKPGRGDTVYGEVLDRHRAGKIDRQHDVPARCTPVWLGRQPDGAGEGKHEADPEAQRRRSGADDAGRGHGPGRCGDAGRQRQREPRSRPGRQHTDRERQHQQEKCQRVGQDRHQRSPAISASRRSGGGGVRP